MRKQAETFLYDVLSRLVKHEVDLINDHQVKIQTHSEGILEQHSIKQKVFNEEMKIRIAEGQQFKADARKRLIQLYKRYSHIVQPYLKRTFDLYGSAPINGVEASAVGKVIENMYGVSSSQRDTIERTWKKFDMLLDFVPTQLRIDTSSSFERKAARQMVMVDHRLPLDVILEEAPSNSWRQRLLAAPYMPSMVERDRFRTKNNDESITIKEVLREHRWIVILGDPGSGKTSFIQWLSTTYIRALINNQNELEYGPARLPIVIRIGEFADALRKKTDLTLFEYIGEHKWFGKAMYSDTKNPTKSTQELASALQDYVRQGQALIILDGLDEIVVSDERMRLVNLVESFVDAYVQTPSHRSVFDQLFQTEVIEKPAEMGGNQLVITSRIVGYHAAPLSGQFSHYIIKKMDLEHINAFVDNWFQKIHAEIIRLLSTKKMISYTSQNKWKIQADRLKHELANPGKIGLQELSSNTCLLSFICSIAFSSEEASLPSQRILLYEKTVNAMLNSWKNKDTNDTTIQESKVIRIFCDIACYIHMHSAAGLIEEKKLKELCMQSLHAYEGKRSPTTEDFKRVEKDAMDFVHIIRRDVGVLAERGESFYGFLHLTFQEYFVCLDLSNVTKYKRIFTSSSEKSLDNVQVLARSLHQHINDPRFRIPITLAFGRLSSKWKKKSVLVDNLCEEFLNFDSSSFFPICSLFLIKSISDFVLEPSADILIQALNRLLVTISENQWYMTDSTCSSQMKTTIYQLSDHIVNKWFQSILSRSTDNDIHLVSALCQLIVRKNADKLEIKGLDALTCNLLTSYLSYDNKQNNFAIDILLTQISLDNHQWLPTPSTSLKKYLISQNINIKRIHPSILSLIIVLYGGLSQDESKVIFDPIRMHRESVFITAELINYFSNKSQSHEMKFVQLKKKCSERLSDIINNDNLVDDVDALVAMLCICGIQTLWTFPSLWSTNVLSMALDRLKQTSMILRQFYTQIDSEIPKDIITDYLNAQSTSKNTSKDHNSRISAHNVLQLIKASASAIARLNSDKKSNLLSCEDSENYRSILDIPSTLKDPQILKNLLPKNITLPSNQLSCSILPEYVELFWILEDDEKYDVQYAMAVAADYIPTFLLFNNDSDPAFALTFVSYHCRTLYLHLMKHSDILVNVERSAKSYNKPVLLFQHVLVESLTRLASPSCKRLSLAFSLCAILPLLRIHGLENIVTSLTSKFDTQDSDYWEQVEFTKHRPINFTTGQYMDGLTGLVNSNELYDNQYVRHRIVREIIQEEKKRINVALLSLNRKNENMVANSQMYSACVTLSYICWLSNDIEPCVLFDEAVNGAFLITEPLLRFDALCTIALNSQSQSVIKQSKNGRNLKAEIEGQLFHVTSNLNCTLHTAILLRCASLSLRNDIIEKSLHELLEKVSKANNLDQQIIKRVLFGAFRFYPFIRSYLLQSLEQQHDDSQELFESKSTAFYRYFHQCYDNNSSDNAQLVLLSSMFVLELTSDLHLINEWLNPISQSSQVSSSIENLQFTRQSTIITGSILTYTQAAFINQFLQSTKQSLDKQHFIILKKISTELHLVSTIESNTGGLIENWLGYENDSILYAFAFHAALLLLQSGFWNDKALSIVCKLLLDEQDRFRQRAEMIFKINSNDKIESSTHLTLHILLKLKEWNSLFLYKSAYASLMCVRKQEDIEINQRSHLDALLLLEYERILTVNTNMRSTKINTLPPTLAAIFQARSEKNLLNVPFTHNLNQFSEDVIQYMCELIQSNFSKFRRNDNSKQSDQECDAFNKFVERVLISLPFFRIKASVSTLVQSLIHLAKANTTNIIKKAAIYAISLSKEEDAVSYLYSVLKSIATNFFNDSHGYSNEVICSTIRGYCYIVSRKGLDIQQNGQIEILRKLLEHPKATISKVTRHGLGCILDLKHLMGVLKSNHIHCYEALLGGTADFVLSSISDCCVESTAALIEQHPDLLSIFVQELYENIRHFTDLIFYKSNVEDFYQYRYPRYVDIAASVAERMPATFCAFVNEFVDGENLKRSLYYTSKQHDFPRRAACLTVLSMFGELTTDLCEMLIQALLDDPYIQNTCYRCISRIHKIKDKQVIVKLKEYLQSKSNNARYASCKLLLQLSNKPDIISIKQVHTMFEEIMCDLQSSEDLWLIVDQEDVNTQSIYYNAGPLKNVVRELLIYHLMNDINTEKSVANKETNSLSIQELDFIASERASRLSACSF